MSNKFTYLFCFVVALSIANTSSAELVAYYRFDEGTGTIAYDLSGYGNDGILEGGPQWVEGEISTALDFSGDGDYVDCGNDASLDITDTISLTMWIKTNDVGDSQHHPYITKGDETYMIKHNTSNSLRMYVYDGGWNRAIYPIDESFNGVWHHVAGTFDGSQIKLYVDGALGATTDFSGSIGSQAVNVNIGRNADYPERITDAVIDEVQIYNHTLNEDEVLEAMQGVTIKAFTAYDPDPADGADEVTPDVVLGWRSGYFTVSRNVYLGTSFDDVNDASLDDPRGVLASPNQAELSFDPPGLLENGLTYYWRIDDVNEAEADSPWKGDVWSFTVLNFPVVIDNFEDYNDYSPNEVWNTWLDGYADDTNGSSAGNPDPDFNIGEHYLETTIVRSGEQSMPLFYDNIAGLSEVSRSITTDISDWTQQGVVTFTLFYHGDAANSAEQLFVAVNGNAVVNNPDPGAVLVTEWTRWDIPLQQFADMGVNLTNVSSLSIGLGDKANPIAGGSGVMYIDDIRLYLPEP